MGMEATPTTTETTSRENIKACRFRTERGAGLFPSYSRRTGPYIETP
jgi:hypothetical protein